MKVYVNTTFEGIGVYQTGAVVVARSKRDAALYLSLELAKRGMGGVEREDMQELIMVEGNVEILSDGDY